MQARIARARHRAPTAAFAINENDVIEVIDRFQAHDQRRKSVLFQDAGSRQRCLEAVRSAVPQNLTKASERFTAGFGVVWQAIEKALHQDRTAQPSDQAPLRQCKDGKGSMVHDAHSLMLAATPAQRMGGLDLQSRAKNAASVSLN
jgi:hypothetical protein